MEDINVFFSRWRRLTPLGEGRYGIVVLAKKDDKLIAVKSANVDDSAGYEWLKHEEIFLKELTDEPYVVRCFGTDESVENGKKTYNLLLEYAAEGDLDDLLMRLYHEKTRMDEIRIARLTRMLLTALSKIHARGIIHCDLKPTNILVFPAVGGHPEQVKIADFGQAERGLPPEKARVWANFRTTSSPESETKADVRRKKGTDLYDSPESVTKGEYGAHTDVWSLGIIVAEMMNPGYYFFDPDKDLYDQIVHEPLSLWRRVPDHFYHSNDAVDFLEKCLARDPADRWSARRLLKHPFITETLKDNPLAAGDKAENPIQPSSDWVASYGLFTTDEDKDDHFTDEELALL